MTSVDTLREDSLGRRNLMIHCIKGLSKIQKDCTDFTTYVQFRFNALQKIAIGCFEFP
jgi:hypothetical protein